MASKKAVTILDHRVQHTKNLKSVVDMYGTRFKVSLLRTGDFESMLILNSYEEFQELLGMMREIDSEVTRIKKDGVHDA
jgi:hypothetical protein